MIARYKTESALGSDAMVGAIFGLMGLLIAFSFSGAYSRYEERKQLIVDEYNAIGTAYLRIDLMPPESQPLIRSQFKAYTNTRAEFFNHLKEPNEALKISQAADQLQKTIWQNAVKNTSDPSYNSARMLLIPSLNDMIDIVAVRSNMIMSHPPLLIYFTLSFFALLCAWMSGFSARTNPKPLVFYSIAFALTISGMLYVILDIEFPSQGFINLNKVNHILEILAQSM